jgi:hypothetical protein
VYGGVVDAFDSGFPGVVVEDGDEDADVVAEDDNDAVVVSEDGDDVADVVVVVDVRLSGDIHLPPAPDDHSSSLLVLPFFSTFTLSSSLFPLPSFSSSSSSPLYPLLFFFFPPLLSCTLL